MFESLIELVKDTTRIVTAPVEIAVDVADAVVKPVAEAAEAVVEEVKNLTK